MLTQYIVARGEAEGGGLRHGWDGSTVGRKALGLAGLPSHWCPPTLVITTSAYNRGASGGDAANARWLFDDASLRTEINRVLGSQTKIPRLIVRSSASDEGLSDRGRYESAICENKDNEIVETVSRLWADSACSTSTLALIIQPFISAFRKGHLSNERRVAKNAQEWVCEYEEVGRQPRARRFIAAEVITPSTGPLVCADRRALTRQLATIATLGTQPWSRVHYEWVWDGQRLWLVQQDIEQPRVGLPPGGTSIQSAQQPPTNFDVLVQSERALGPWHKTACVRVFHECGLRTIPVYTVEGDIIIRGLAEGKPDSRLVSDIERLGASPIVVRTDVENGAECPPTLLPRTDSVDAQGAIVFLIEHAKKLVGVGLKPSQFCFLLHNYIMAKGASLSRAVPTSSSVTIDATWGNADGLMYYPHDTFEVLLGKKARVKPLIRCKDRFIDCTDEGRWAERDAGIPWDWEPSLSKPDIINIARATKKIADYLGHAVEVMHFVGVDAGEFCLVCLPWYYDSASKNDANPGQGLQSVSIFSKDVITIRNVDDIRREAKKAGMKKPSRGCTLRLVPSQDLLRNQQFLAEVSSFAIQYGLPVRLVGSALSHVFYVLRRHGVKLKVPLQSHRNSRKRRFNKLVRDKIPEIIRGHGELARVAHVKLANHPELVKAKLLEEAFELFWEQDPNGLRRELADMLEVMHVTCGVIGIKFEEVSAEADRRREDRGGFDAGTILLDTGPDPATLYPLQPTLFDTIEEAGGKNAELVVATKPPAPGEPRGTRNGISIPLIPPESNHQQLYSVRSADGRLDVLVNYSGRKVIIRPAPDRQMEVKPVGKVLDAQGSLFDTESTE